MRSLFGFTWLLLACCTGLVHLESRAAILAEECRESQPHQASRASGPASFPRSGVGLPTPAPIHAGEIRIWALWLGWTPTRRSHVELPIRDWQLEHGGGLAEELHEIRQRASSFGSEFALDDQELARWEVLLRDTLRLRDRIAADEEAMFDSLINHPQVALGPEELQAIRSLRTLSRCDYPPLIGIRQLDLFAWLVDSQGWDDRDFAEERVRAVLSRYLDAAAILQDRRMRVRIKVMAEFPRRHSLSRAAEAPREQPQWTFWSDLTTPNADAECALARLCATTLRDIDEIRVDAPPLLPLYLAEWRPEEFASESEAIDAVIGAVSACSALGPDHRSAATALLAELRAGAPSLLRRRFDANLQSARDFAITRQRRGVPLEAVAELPSPDGAGPSEPLERFLLVRLQAVRNVIAEACPAVSDRLAKVAERLAARIPENTPRPSGS